MLEASIADGLNRIVGPAGFKLITMEVPLHRAAENPKLFHDVIVSIFMERGASLIEREIAKNLLLRLSMPDISHGSAEKQAHGQPAHVDARHQVELLRRFAKSADLPGHQSSESIDSAADSFAEAFTTGR